ncbi:MAG: ATP-binding cassette domain-containing protein [Pseudarcicella sp.]|nr:ATP-binding cassette domain-containing protein [Pseudarcicella sp.]MBP6409660.1 ATP-binding cassette domain-containing protein [Pseudarcicella sp.]
MIAVKNLHFAYSNDQTIAFQNFSCDANKSLLVLGESGKGKTTLLHLLGLLLKPDSGEIFINNKLITQLPNAEINRFRAENIGIVFQQSHFVQSLTVKENLLLVNYLGKQKESIERVQELASQLGFENHLNKKTNQLSQGEQQRVSIARALMNKPSVILADEPTSSLDDSNCVKVIDLLQKQSSEIKATLLIVTHDQRLKQVFDHNIIL